MSRPAYLDHRPGEPWTIRQLRSLEGAIKRRGDMTSIAREMGLADNTLRAVLTYHGRPACPPTLDIRVAIALSKTDASSTVALAERLGSHRNSLAAAIRAHRKAGRVALEASLPARRTGKKRGGYPRRLWRLTAAGREWLQQQVGG